MSSDQRLASAEPGASAGAASGIVRDAVVVPLRATARRLAPPVGAAGPVCADVAQFTDYLHRARRPATESSAPRPAAPLPAVVKPHADELDWLLRAHIETHLDLIAARAPDLAQPIDNVRRSVELLLRLRRD